ncbi:MAG: alpha/beta hydrolase [Opitutaceae bacterium]
MSTVRASDGLQLHYDIHGTGPTDLILLHGMGESSTSWEVVLTHLDLAAFRVVTLDLRGHGHSRGGEMRFTFPQLTADILAVADAAGVRRAVVVAHSGSSKNAVCLALEAPERVRGLMLICPPGMGEVPLPREIMRSVFDHIGRERDIPLAFDAWFTPKIGRYREIVGRDYAQTSRAALDASAELWMHTSIVENAARVSQPVLVIAGAKEPVYHPEFQRQTTLVALPHARLESLACGHFATYEEPAALAEAIARFSRELP